VFSSRIQTDLTPNRLTLALAELRAKHRSLIDLTESNPTRAGFDYASDLLEPLSDQRGLSYAPRPFGSPAAREAVARDYARRGISVRSDRIILTASTSEAYSVIFKALCDPGDEVLVPRPSYPLLEHLTRLDAVAVKPYALEYHGSWAIDLESLARARSPRTRVVLTVSPNNPTGSFVSAEELDRLGEIAAGCNAAIVADEVFADYERAPGAAAGAGSILLGSEVLAFSLGGLSKSVGLPQLKMGWMALNGPEPIVAEALMRLELVCDSYLSVSTPVQEAAGELIRRGAPIRQQIQARVTGNYRCLVDAARAAPACRVLSAQGGWYAILQVPALMSEEDLVLDLLVCDGVLVHPGYFFDFSREAFLIVSLLPPSAEFAEGISRILARFDGAHAQP